MSDATEITNIAGHLPVMAEKFPHTTAVYFPQARDWQGRIAYTHYTFAQLDAQSDRMAIGLERIGVQQGMRTVLMVKPGLDFFALTFALFKIGAIPILVDPGMGVENLKTCLDEAQPEAFIGIPKAHLARVLFGWGKKTIRIRLTAGRRYAWGGISLKQMLAHVPINYTYTMASTKAEDTAAILFTSGSTGVPKGVVYTHLNFSSQVSALRRLYNIRPGEIDLPTFPLFALFAPALGMTSVIPDMDFTRPSQIDPEALIQTIENFGVQSMFGSPALIRRLARYGEQHGSKLPSLKRVISAGAPVPAVVLKQFSQMLGEDTQIFTPYGATEALPVCSIGSHEVLNETAAQTDQGKGICVGRAVEGLKLHVIATSDDVIAQWSDSLSLPVGEIGEIVVQGPQVTQQYFNRYRSTELAKINDPATEGGFFHRMGDLGYIDGSGRVWFCGRKSHRVNTSAGVLYTIPCEAIFNTHPQVFRSALVGIPQGELARPVICIELERKINLGAEAELRTELIHLARQFEITSKIDTVLFHPEFPVDIRHNAKIFREKLVPWAQDVLA